MSFSGFATAFNETFRLLKGDKGKTIKHFTFQTLDCKALYIPSYVTAYLNGWTKSYHGMEADMNFEL